MISCVIAFSGHDDASTSTSSIKTDQSKMTRFISLVLLTLLYVLFVHFQVQAETTTPAYSSNNTEGKLRKSSSIVHA